MANIAKCKSNISNEQGKGRDLFAFTRRFLGYNEATEGIIAQQKEADRRLLEIQAQKAIRKAKGVA